MRTTAITCRWIVGLLFVVAAALKAASAMDFAVQVSYYGVVRTPWIVLTVAVTVIGLEAALGMALLVWRARRTGLFGIAASITIAFTALIVYAWIWRNLQDCGCFGKYLKMTPGWSIVKNAVALGLIALAWRGERTPVEALGAVRKEKTRFGASVQRLALAAAVSMLLMVGACVSLARDDVGTDRIRRQEARDGSIHSVSSSSGAQAAPTPKSIATPPGMGADKFSGYVFDWEGKHYDLTRGLYIVVMISDSCEGCAEIVRSLNALAVNKDLPPIVAFVLGEKATLENFRKNYSPAFPTNLMAPLDFLDRIGEAPPRFILVREGRQLRYWDTKRAPDEVTLLEAVLTAP
jgi:hypothetical protein